MLEGIIFFSSESALFPNMTRQTKVRCHWILMLCTAICSVIGLMVIWWSKELNGKSHYTTWHGLLGLVTVCYSIMQCCAGVFQLYPSVPQSFGIKLFQLKAYHATSGLLLFTLVCLSLFLGMYSNWFVRNVTGTSWYACVACPMIMALVVLNQVSNHYLPNKSHGTTQQMKKGRN